MPKSLKRVAASVMAVVLTCGVAACGSARPAAGGSAASSDDEVTLNVFAAASMTESLAKAGDAYMAEHPNVKIVYDFDSSGTLKTQIQEGAECDLFISAGQKAMDQMDATAADDVNTEGLDLIDPDSRVNILKNKVVLVAPEGNPKNVTSFDDLAAKLKAGGVLMAMGNSDVPVGQYTSKILAYYRLDEDALAKAGSITYASNVKEVTSQVEQGAVDCGVVYQTDAHSASLGVIDTATEDMCGKTIYPAAVTRASKHADAARAFLEYLQGAEASKQFKAVGFEPLSNN